MFPEQKSIWILVISLPYLEALKLFNLYLVLCVWLVDHLQENMCKFFFNYLQFHEITNSWNHKNNHSRRLFSLCLFFSEFPNSWNYKFTNCVQLVCIWYCGTQIHKFTGLQVHKFTKSRIHVFMRSKEHKFSSMDNNIYFMTSKIEFSISPIFQFQFLMSRIGYKLDGVTDSVWSFCFGPDGCPYLTLPKYVGIFFFWLLKYWSTI